jgi:hypothetical protein
MSAEGTRYPSLIQFHSIPTWLDERASERERERGSDRFEKDARERGENAARMRRHSLSQRFTFYSARARSAVSRRRPHPQNAAE